MNIAMNTLCKAVPKKVQMLCPWGGTLYVHNIVLIIYNSFVLFFCQENKLICTQREHVLCTQREHEI